MENNTENEMWSEKEIAIDIVKKVSVEQKGNKKYRLSHSLASNLKS